MPESKLASKKWSGVQFARVDLIRSAFRLLDDGVVWVPGEADAASLQLCRLDELGQVGPDRRDVWDGFERTICRDHTYSVGGESRYRAASKESAICAAPDKYLAHALPKPGQNGQRHLKSRLSLWQFKGQDGSSSPKGSECLTGVPPGSSQCGHRGPRECCPTYGGRSESRTTQPEKAGILAVWMNSSLQRPLDDPDAKNQHKRAVGSP